MEEVLSLHYSIYVKWIKTTQRGLLLKYDNIQTGEIRNNLQLPITLSVLSQLMFQNNAYKLHLYTLGFRRFVYLTNHH